MPSSRPTFAPPATRSWMADPGALFDIALEPVGKSSELEQVGPYRLVAPLGEGGLGVVWKAEQIHPVRRMVALKLIRPGLHVRKDVVSRFELERRTLARMTHPGIAMLHDAGTTVDGRPWFAMELVEGTPLTTFCQEHRLDLRQRLDLFVAICDAVHHAHQKGVLHRDLKPSNILVSGKNGEFSPKIIDFGIAKLIDPTDDNDWDAVMTTRIGDLPSATYPYMSPEQASRDTAGIDIRSDVYTLGVILYELLTGHLPMPVELVRRQDFGSLSKWIRESDPPRPSERARSPTPLSCPSASLRGDLDWIILRAMAKEPGRRYSSAAALSDDLSRHLADEPVTAGAPGQTYLLKKWLKRHRLLVTAGSTILLGLGAALTISLGALSREKQALRNESGQRALAEQRAKEANAASAAAQAARQAEAEARTHAEKALSEAQQAQKVAATARGHAESLINDMLFDLRDQLTPIGRISLLDEVSKSAERYFASMPPGNDSDFQSRQRAAMHQNRGAVVLAQGNTTAALEHFGQSLQIARDLAKRQPDNRQSQKDLIIALDLHAGAQAAAGKYDAVPQQYEEMLQIGTLHGLPAEVALAHERLGDLARQHGQLDSARQHYKEGMASLERAPTGTASSRRLAFFEERLGSLAELQGDAAGAEPHYAREMDMLQALLKQSPGDRSLLADEATAAGRLASLHARQGRLDERTAQLASHQLQVFSELILQDPLHVGWRRSLGVSHFQQGMLMEQQNDLRSAEQQFRAALKHFSLLPMDASREAAGSHLRLAICLARQNQMDAAKESARQSLEMIRRIPSDATLGEWRRTAEAILK